MGSRCFRFPQLYLWPLVQLARGVLGCFAGAVFFLLGSGYHRIRPFEQEGRLYEKVGIRFFQKLVGRGPWTILNPTLRFSRRRAQLAALEREMYKAEAGHLVVFLAVTMTAVFAAVRGWLDSAGWLMLFNVPLNFYPVMLQRRNRAHIQRISRKGQIVCPTEQRQGRSVRD